MPKEIPANVALNWRPDGGKRSRGRPKKSLRATLMQDLRDCGTNWYQAPKLANNRKRWMEVVARCRQAGGTR